MLTPRLRLLAIAGLIFEISIPRAAAQPIFAKPTITQGDSWEFTSSGAGGTTGKWSRTVLRVLAEDRLEVQYQNKQIHYYDQVMNYVGSKADGEVSEYARFPMHVGDSWSYARRFPDPNSEDRGDSKVVAFESVTVPAGTFDCFRVETTVSNAARWSTTETTWIRWYCPAIKWIAKQEYRSRTSSRSGLGSATNTTSELLQFRSVP